VRVGCPLDCKGIGCSKGGSEGGVSYGSLGIGGMGGTSGLKESGEACRGRRCLGQEFGVGDLKGSIRGWGE